MINTLSLLFGLLGTILVTIRAVIADRRLPWFKPVPEEMPPGPKVPPRGPYGARR